MSDLDQLKTAIQQMSTDPNATQFVTQVFQADNFQFLKLVTQILLSPNLPNQIMINSVTLISVVLRPSLLRPINKITDNYYTFSEDERTQIKQAIIVGLTQEDHATRLGFAYCLGLIVEIDKQYNKTNRILYEKQTIFDQYLIGLIQNQPTPYAPIGSIMAITQILENQSINTKLKRYQNLGKIILDVGYAVLSNNSELTSLLLEFKIECIRCISEALKADILNDLLFRNDEKVRFLQNLIPVAAIQNVQLHKHLLIALKHFIIMIYKIYFKNNIEESVLPFVEQIFKSTIQPVASIKNENFDLQASEPYVSDVIELWMDIASFESKHRGILNITEMIAKHMDELLFTYVSTLPVENLLSIEPESSISYLSFKCINKFSLVAPKVIFDHALQVFESSINSNNNNSIFIALVAAQIIFYIRIPRKDEEQIQNLSTETLFKILTEIIKFTSFDDPSIVSSAYSSIITAISFHPKLCKDPNFFTCLIQSISNTLQSDLIVLIHRCLLTFVELVSAFDQKDEDSNLSGCYQFVLAMLMDATGKEKIMSNPDVAYELYNAISNYILRLPQSINSQEIYNFAVQILDQMKKSILNRTDEGLQTRVWQSIIVYGIAQRLQNDFAVISLDFLNILVTTCEEVNSSNSNIISQESVVLAIGYIVCIIGRMAEPIVSRIYDIALRDLSTQDPTFVNSSSQLLTSLLVNFKDLFFNYIPNILNIVIECLYSQMTNEVSIYFLLETLVALLNMGCNDQDPTDIILLQAIGENLIPKREDLMNFAVNLISYLRTWLEYGDNAEKIFNVLLQLFTVIMKIYSYEAGVNPIDVSKKVPSAFLSFYVDQFINLIETGHSLGLWDVSIGFAFVNYLMTLIQTFDTFGHVNVKIHKPGFKFYINESLDSDNSALRQAMRVVKVYYDKS